MSTSSPLIINFILILSLLFVCSSAQFFLGFPGHKHKQNDNDEQQTGVRHLPGLGAGLGGLLRGIGRLRGDQDEEKEEEIVERQRQEEEQDEQQSYDLPKDSQEDKQGKDEQTLPGKQGDEQEKGNNKEEDNQGKGEQPMPTKQGNQAEVPKEQNKPVQQQVGQPAEMEQTNYAGKWEIVSQNSGVSAMHLQLMPTNKLVMFDATSLGKSSIELPHGRCRLVPNTTNVFDCYAHAVEYDLQTNNVRTLKVETDPWCSSGGLAPDGTLINTGGWKEGERITRFYESCPTCDWKESKVNLSDVRWYGTQAQLADGRYIVLGGRRAFNYEFVVPIDQPSSKRIDLPFLFETTDLHENNLYPFVHLAPDGNFFILANYRSLLLDVRTNKIVRKYPDLPGGARNYPGSATTAILPINLQNGGKLDIEVVVCGGGQPLAFGKAEKEKIFLPALDTCGRIKVLDPAAKWEIETMPAARIMSDMLNLPNGEILILNGAKKGASGWEFAEDPIFTPFLYSPNKPNGNRFKVLAATTIARMYHSTSAVLAEGKILVAGSNTNPGYLFQGVKFPTELRVEKFSPPYLDPALDKFKPKKVHLGNKVIGYGQTIQITCNIFAPAVQQKDIMVTIYKPPFTTHGYSMNQRLLVLKVTSVVPQQRVAYQLQVEAPPSGEVAPPGYYLLFVNYRGVPGAASWIQLH